MKAFPLVRSGEPGWPPLLEHLHDPPRQLYVRGDPSLLARPAVAIVGARRCSAYGAQVARSLARDLAGTDVTVVSGLARGIDGEAHRGALAAGGPTVAVLGCGIDVDYPARHAELARRIAETGAIVSEYPPGTEPAPWRFPARNRIVAGLAQATVVVEARERSGALITADFALELGREVFAVPGEITASLSTGANRLIRQGAAPLLSADDVLEALGVDRPGARPRAVCDGPRGVLALLADAPRSADELVRASGRPAADVAGELVELELAGRVTEADGVYRATIAS
ncbi:MAG TPA: DNA-processing protein DprA [Gaiellaceae bacterium]|nr:DNA-processing protein DprA [Gaiellaceae bacterium]